MRFRDARIQKVFDRLPVVDGRRSERSSSLTLADLERIAGVATTRDSSAITTIADWNERNRKFWNAPEPGTCPAETKEAH